MTITQLEYIVALNEYKSFSKAAKFCCVTQPSLSMQIQKLEEELNLIIFNRKIKPIKPTTEGLQIINAARKIIQEKKSIQIFAQGYHKDVIGEVSIGIIPTIAPYLIPKFLSSFQTKFPNLKLNIFETTTENIYNSINEGKLDIGILVPITNQVMSCIPLFFEELFLFSNVILKNGEIDQNVIPEKLWILEEGHCLSNQIASICNLRNKSNSDTQIVYKTGSLETMLRLAENGMGQTIIPNMLVDYVSESVKKKIFKIPFNTPVREIALIYSENYNRKGVIDALKEEITSVIPKEWISAKNKYVIPLSI
jgi:LysR family hydrogen peroxide-inducible transcriptional activator